jgi:hypothetical protein
MTNRRVLALLCAFAATSVLSAGTGAVAATVITSADIKDDTIKPVDLNFPIGLEAEMFESEDLTLSKGFSKVLTANYSNDDDPGELAIGYGVVEVENPTSDPVDVTIRLQHKNEPDHTAEFTVTVGPGESESAPAGFVCNYFPAGLQTVIMSVSGPGAVVTDASLSMIAAPQR